MSIKHEHELNSFTKFVRPSKKTIVLILSVAVITMVFTTTVAILLSRMGNLKVPSLGTVKTLGVEAYGDINLENKTLAIDWGTIWPGSSQNVTLYIKSISNIETTLLLNTTNWNPASISDYMNLSWNYTGTTIHPSEVIEVTLTLSASSSYSFVDYLIINDVRRFSFDIIIMTQEYS